MNVFFVYDTALCKTDEDDPKDAIVYFYPLQFSEIDRYFLCFHLAGVAKFLKATFSSPSVIGLDQGKFAFLQSGNYLLVLGSNHKVLTNVLREQLSFLCQIFCFYHGSINNVLKECKDDRNEFLVKLELSWSRYLSLSQCLGNVLQFSPNVLPLKTYRKSSGIVRVADRLLHLCQMNSSVIAGSVFYKSRVLSTQFMPQVTNFLSLLSNSNASVPVSDTDHGIENLPPDAELKCVYLSPKLLSSILKFNNTCIDSRAKSITSKVQPLFSSGSYKEAIDSGSEGDVDSGNCSESFQSRKHKDTNVRHQVSNECTITCCTSHGRIFARSLMRSQNPSDFMLSRNFGNNNAKRPECKNSRFDVFDDALSFKFRHHMSCNATNLFCQSHAKMLASSVENKFCHYTNLRSCSDTEFQCSFCINSLHSHYIRHCSLKKWNTYSNLSGHVLSISKFISAPPRSSTSSDNNSLRAVERKIKGTKQQILKCRSNSDGKYIQTKSSLTNPSQKRLTDASIFGDQRGPSRLLNFNSSDLNIERNELQKFVVYVQRYGGSTLVLLLHKEYNDRVIDYLWNCGFTLLGQLESNSENQPIELSLTKEPSIFILLYNHAHKILKEFPHFPSSLLAEKHSKEMIQKVQEEFQCNPYFQTMCLLSKNYSIFATCKDDNIVLYLQPETKCCKLEPLFSLQKKASRRIGKYFKIII